MPNSMPEDVHSDILFFIADTYKAIIDSSRVMKT